MERPRHGPVGRQAGFEILIQQHAAAAEDLALVRYTVGVAVVAGAGGHIAIIGDAVAVAVRLTGIGNGIGVAIRIAFRGAQATGADRDLAFVRNVVDIAVRSLARVRYSRAIAVRVTIYRASTSATYRDLGVVQDEVVVAVHRVLGQRPVSDQHHAVPPRRSEHVVLDLIEPVDEPLTDAESQGHPLIHEVIIPHPAGLGAAPGQQAVTLRVEDRRPAQIIRHRIITAGANKERKKGRLRIMEGVLLLRHPLEDLVVFLIKPVSPG